MGDLPPKSGCLTGKSDNHQWFTLSVRIMTRVGLLAVGFCLRELLRLLIQTVVAILFRRVHHSLPLILYVKLNFGIRAPLFTGPRPTLTCGEGVDLLELDSFCFFYVTPHEHFSQQHPHHRSPGGGQRGQRGQ